MAALDAKPEEFGLRVRASPAGLAITAANKMRRGIKVRLSYSGDIPETVIFDLADSAVRRNYEALEKFIGRLDAARPSVPGFRQPGLAGRSRRGHRRRLPDRVRRPTARHTGSGQPSSPSTSGGASGSASSETGPCGSSAAGPARSHEDRAL